MKQLFKCGLWLLVLIVCQKSLVAAWSTPVSLSSVGSPAFPQLAVDSSGKGFAIWQQNITSSTSNTTSNILVSSLATLSSTWVGPITISQSTVGGVVNGKPQNNFSPQIVIDSLGNAIAIWQSSAVSTSSSISSSSIQVSRLYLGTTTWSTPETISSADNSVTAPQIAMNSKGEAVATWTSLIGNTYFVRASTLASITSTWTTPVSISTLDQNAYIPRAAIDESTNRVLVWQQISGANFVIQAAALSKGSTSWTAPQTLSEAGLNANTPDVAADGLGNAVAIWSRQISSSNSLSIQAAKYTFTKPTSGWTSFVQIATSSATAPTPRIAMSGGKGVAVWIGQVSGSTTNLIQGSTLTAISSTWSAVQNVSATGLTGNATGQQVVMHSTKKALTVWSLPGGTNISSIQSSTLKAIPGTWTTPPLTIPALNTTVPGVSSAPQVRFAGADTAISVWQNLSGTTASIQASIGTAL